MNMRIIKFFARACALALVIAVAPLSAAAAADSDVKSNLENRLNPYENISISVDDNTVILSGTVETSQQRDAALKLARETSGVSSVKDEIRVTHGDDSQTVGEYVDDAVITAKVKADLLTEKGLESGGISVETNDGVVMLTGTVKDKAQISMAQESAEGVTGVKGVDNRLSVKAE